jgi:hypothetical protein
MNSTTVSREVKNIIFPLAMKAIRDIHSLLSHMLRA